MLKALRLGHQRRISFIQLGMVDLGTISRCGPLMFCARGQRRQYTDKRERQRGGLGGHAYLVVLEEAEERDGLERLAEAHLVGEDAVDSVLVQIDHPVETADLVVTHRPALNVCARRDR
jgi:hypothetical protein